MAKKQYGLSDDDQRRLEENSRGWAEAKERGDQDAMNRYHADSESIRSGYGYSGGADGSGHILNRKPGSTGGGDGGKHYTPPVSYAQSKAMSGGSYQPMSKLDAGDAAYKAGMGAADIMTLLNYKNQAGQAASEGRTGDIPYWNKKAEDLRAMYGYSGGPDGSQYIKINNGDMPPGGATIGPYQPAPEQTAPSNPGTTVPQTPADTGGMSPEDYAALLKAKSDYDKYKAAGDQAGMDASHQAAENIRYKYGFSGGADGSGRIPRYIPIDKSGNDYAGMVNMSPIDLAGLIAAKEGYAAAQAAGDEDKMKANHLAAEAIRAKYNFSGGPDGSQWIPNWSAPDVPDFEQPEYNSPYQDKMDSLADSILNRDPFSYDYLKDPMYLMMEDSYTRNGQRAARDIMGQLAANTGGLSSSWAGTMSNQTYDQHMQQLADRIPQLRDAAYKMYMGELDQDRADMGMLQGLESANRGRWESDRGFNYGVYSDKVNGAREDNIFDYGVYRDLMSDDKYREQVVRDEERYQKEWEREERRYQEELQRRIAAETDEKKRFGMENAWSKLQSGVVPTAAELKDLNMTLWQAQDIATRNSREQRGWYRR